MTFTNREQTKSSEEEEKVKVSLTEHLTNDIHENTEAYDCSVNQVLW